MVEFPTFRHDGTIFNSGHEPDSEDDIQIIELDDPLASANNSAPPGHDSDSDVEVIDTFANVEVPQRHVPPNRRKRNRFISSTSSSDGDEDVSNSKPSSPNLFQPNIPDEVSDGEGEVFIPIDDDDEDDGAEIEYNERGNPKCRICEVAFKNKITFRMHQKRHFSANHFICPTCQRGFTTFDHCQTHELKEHHQKSADAASSKSDEENYYSHEPPGYIVTSTSLYPYRGPSMEGKGQFTPYEIFLNYSKSERRSHTMIQAKYQQKLRQQRDEEEALEKKSEAKELKQKIPTSKARNRTSVVSRRTRQSDEEIEIANETPDDDDADYVPNSLTKQRKRKIVKWYYCDICSYQCGGEEEMRNHAKIEHPDIPASEVIHFIKGPPPEAPSQPQPKRIKLRSSVPKSDSIIVQKNGVLQKKGVKQKKKVKRLKTYRRVWEKDGKVPLKIEFLSALGLVGKSDVILGPREGTAAVFSSLYHKRKGRRERSPSPRARIILNKLPRSENKCFRTCLHCDFFAISRTDIRRHYTEVHPGIGSATLNSRSNKPNFQQQIFPKPNTSSTSANVNLSAAAPPPYVRCSICKYNASSALELDTHLKLTHRNDEYEKIKRLTSVQFIL